MKDKENKDNSLSSKNTKKRTIRKNKKVNLEASKKDEKNSSKTLLNKKSDKVSELHKINSKRKTENAEINKTITFTLLEVVIIILITGISVSIASALIVYNNYDKEDKQNSTEIGNNLKEFEENYNKIINNYVEDVDKDKLLESAISGMYNYLNDEYSVYISKEESETLEEQLQGEYTGIGVEITTFYENNDVNNTVTTITKVFSNSPAEKAGLVPGDIITKVDGVDVVDANTISDTIKKGSKDTYEITYVRDGKENKTSITRNHVVIDSVAVEKYDTVGYLRVDTFSGTTKSQIEKALDSFDSKIKSLIIDLRDNTGGYLSSAYDIADLFIEKGKVIYQLKDRNGKIDEFKAQNNVYKKFDKIVVLINQNSASASEVLALALKESSNSKIVGVKSYGKGTVQEAETLSSGAMVKYTSSYWLSPNGNSINKVGITPDVVEEDVNEQLNKAIETAK